MVEKSYITLLGNISLKRACYYNKEKGTGIYPVEEKYNSLKDVCFPEVKELICYTSSMEPYAQAQEILEKLSKITVSSSEIQKRASRNIS